MEITEIINVSDPFIICDNKRVSYSWEHQNLERDWYTSNVLWDVCKIQAFGNLNGERVALIKRIHNKEKERIVIKTKELRRIGWFNEFNYFKNEPIRLSDYQRR